MWTWLKGACWVLQNIHVFHIETPVTGLCITHPPDLYEWLLTCGKSTRQNLPAFTAQHGDTTESWYLVATEVPV